jgi:hydrogenase/urease accessory protein HupE
LSARCTAYLVGFSIMQYLVVTGGIKLLDPVASRSHPMHDLALRVGGAATPAVGAVFLGLGMS